MTRNYSYYVVPKGFTETASQCDIFRLTNKARAVVGPLGTDPIYAMILNKPVYLFLTKWATENYWEVARANLRQLNPFRIIYTDVVDDEKSKARIDGETFEKWRIRNFLRSDLILTKENINDLLILLNHAIH